MQYLKAGTYTLSGGKTNKKQVSIAGKYIDGTNVPGWYDTGNGKTLTLEQDAWVYPQIIITEGEVCTNDVFKIQLELGSAVTEFELHQGDAYPITFPVEAGTVYGGYINLTTGKLTVDHAVYICTGNENITKWNIAGSST